MNTLNHRANHSATPEKRPISILEKKRPEATPACCLHNGIQRRRWLFLLVGIVLLGSNAVGCHRSQYRRQADAEAMRLISEKANSPHWDLSNYQLSPNPESRMATPFSLDHPPMPPDDPYSHRLMHTVDGKPGFPLWHANGDTWAVENPEWTQYLPLNEDGELELNFQTAVQTALLHSRDYQRQQEELYLSALDVSLERFNFDSQLFFGYGGFFTADGPDRNGSGVSSSTFEASTGTRGLRLQKLGITGSTLVVGFANSLLWEYSGPDSHTATTFIDFSLIQPLLQRAGRDRIMEGLTAAERTLLGNVRQIERYRRGFTLEVTTGRPAGSGVSRSGSFLGGSAGGGAGGAGGLFGLLRDQQNIQITAANVASLRSFLAQFREYNQVGRVDRLQVQQSETALYSAQDQLIRLRNAYQTSLDFYKIALGLPPQLPVRVNDPLLNQFQLFDPATIDMQNAITELQRVAGESIIRIEDRRSVFLEPTDADSRITDTTVDGLYWSEQDVQDLLALKQLIEEAREINRAIRTDTIAQARQDIERLRQSLDQRRANLQRLRDQLSQSSDGGGYAVEPEILAIEGLDAGPAERESEIETLELAFAEVERGFEELEQSIDQYIEFGGELPPIELYSLLYDEILKVVPKQLADLSGRFLELSLVLVRARTDAITRTPIALAPDLALEIARRNRRDWMNARSDLVDAWRQIEFSANDLESAFDLVFEGDLSNKGDNPLRLRGTTGRLRAGFQFDAPFTRLVERNNYREVLIQYDRTRRTYYAFEDEVSRSLREILRNIEQNKISFELSRRSIIVAVAQVELARYNLIEPPEPGAVRSTLGATTARDLNGALQSLQQAQLRFLDVWVTYEVLRRTLDYELGTMQLDEFGNWLDPGEITPENAQRLLQESTYSEFDVAPGIGAWLGDEAPTNWESLPPEMQSPMGPEIQGIEPLPLIPPNDPQSYQLRDGGVRDSGARNSGARETAQSESGSSTIPPVIHRTITPDQGNESRIQQMSFQLPHRESRPTEPHAPTASLDRPRFERTPPWRRR